MKFALGNALVIATWLLASTHASPTTRRAAGHKFFHRIATFLVCEQLPEGCNDSTETVAEIVYSADSGNKLVYTDGAREVIGEYNLKQCNCDVQ